jgi:hypothetical protein
MNITDGVRWILVVQSRGAWLEMARRFFTFLGYEKFFFLVLPLVYSSDDASRMVSYGWRTLVVFSFQISKAAQDVAGRSVIMPSLR